MIAATSASGAVQTVSTNVSLDATLDLSATSSDCANNPGPHITFSGVIAFGDFDVTLIFRNNDRGTHEYTDTTTVSATLDFSNNPITIPKQPVLGGVGGNPYIWVQFLDANGHAVTDEIYLGRCVQGLDTSIEETFTVPGLASISADGDNCDNSPGPYITLSGEIALSQMSAKIIFRNNVKGTHEAVRESTASVTLIPDDTSLVIPKQPVLGGVGGNPKVWLAVGDDEFYLGRCNQDL